MHECQEIRSANINQKEDRFLIYERDLLTVPFTLLIFLLLHFFKIVLQTMRSI
jgi:hypothetical protein